MLDLNIDIQRRSRFQRKFRWEDHNRWDFDAFFFRRKIELLKLALSLKPELIGWKKIVGFDIRL